MHFLPTRLLNSVPSSWLPLYLRDQVKNGRPACIGIFTSILSLFQFWPICIFGTFAVSTMLKTDAKKIFNMLCHFFCYEFTRLILQRFHANLSHILPIYTSIEIPTVCYDNTWNVLSKKISFLRSYELSQSFYAGILKNPSPLAHY